MILVIGNIKGGVGKTTLAVNLAIARQRAGHDVLLIDGDEQKTAITFTELRAEQMPESGAGYTVISLQGKALRTEVSKLAEKYDDVIIDCGGRVTDSLRAALTVADMLLVPVQPRSFDIWAIEPLVELVKEARAIKDFRAYMILNGADSTGRDNEEAAEALRETTEIELLPFTIGRRKSFPNAASQGRSVLEMNPKDQKAIDELNAVIAAIYPATAKIAEVANGRRR